MTLLLLIENYNASAMNVEETNNKSTALGLRNPSTSNTMPEVLVNRATKKEPWYIMMLEVFSFAMASAPLPLPDFSLLYARPK